jgi:hypothetical protein|tara:strand:- start:159 stop:923 length:765 start_codon:yes stop_codon:yes gene_type:complete
MLELIEIFFFGSNDPGANQAFIGTAMAIGGLAQMAMGYDWGGKRKKALAKSRAIYEKQKDVFRNLDTSNVYADIENKYEGMENAFEDIRVNTQQAQFEKQMFQQSQANTLRSLKGAAGGSGVAGLAQAMSNQAMTQAQRASASIGQQEAKNKMLAAQQSAKIDQLERAGADKTQQLIAKGELTSMQMEQSKQSTLLGMDAQSVTGAQQAVQAGNQMMASGIGSVIGGVSDMRTNQTGLFAPKKVVEGQEVQEGN